MERLVHNILSPLRHDRKPLIFQWALTLRNAGIGSFSNPAFYTLKNEWLPVVTCHETETIALASVKNHMTLIPILSVLRPRQLNVD